MPETPIQTASPMDVIWLLEFAVLSLPWVIIRFPGPVKSVLRLRAAAEWLLLILAMSGITVLCFAFIRSESFFLLLQVACQAALTSFYTAKFFKHRKQTKLLLWFSLTTASMSVFHIAGQCGSLLDTLHASAALQGVTRVAIQMLLIPIAFWLRRLNFDDYAALPKSGLRMLGLSMVSVLLLYAAETFSPAGSDQRMGLAFLAGYLGLLIMTLAAVDAFYAMCRERKTVVDLQAERQRIRSEQDQARITEAMLHDLRSIRHDLKNQYAYMQILLGEKRYDDLEKYFSELVSALPAPLNIVDCGNRTVNTVLNMEFAKLRADRIPFSHRLVVPPVLPFLDEDVCAVLSNLIDNAAEECRRLREKGGIEPDVALDIHPHQSYLIIKCDNPTDRTALHRVRGGLMTTKGEDGLHGYGTQIIRKLAEKYNGYADYSLTEGRFVAQVMLDMTTEAANR